MSNNAGATDSSYLIFSDDAGGERGARALRGDSPLGELDDIERDYLATALVRHWERSGNLENICEAAEDVADDPQASAALAKAYAGHVADYERHIAQGGQWLTTPEAGAARHEILGRAIELDAAGTVAAFDGIEGRLGLIAGSDRSADGRRHQVTLLNLVNDGQLTNAQADRLVTSLFTNADGDALGPYGDSAYRDALSGALARVLTPPGPPPATEPAHTAVQQKLLAAFDESGARDMLTNSEVLPELRGWALAQSVRRLHHRT